MATFAHGEVVIAERALAVMTTRAALTAAGGMMIQRFWRSDLSTLRQAGAHLMTVVTVSLRIMFRVTESNSEGRHVLRRTCISAQLVTRAA